MPILFDIETDFLYLKGFEKGLQIGIEKWKNHKNAMLVEKFLIESLLDTKRIAEFVEVTEAFVLSIQNRLIKEGKLKSETLKDKKDNSKTSE